MEYADFPERKYIFLILIVLFILKFFISKSEEILYQDWNEKSDAMG